MDCLTLPGYEPPKVIHLLLVSFFSSVMLFLKYAKSASACSLLKYDRFSTLKSLKMMK